MPPGEACQNLFLLRFHSLLFLPSTNIKKPPRLHQGMTILVTGCAGFIGSHVVEALLDEQQNVIGIDDLNDYYDVARKRANLEGIRSHPNARQFAFHQVDVTNRAALEAVFSETPRQAPITVVIHLAARAGVRASFREPDLYRSVNVDGTRNLLELSKQHGARGFVFASSSSVYGNTRPPFKETDAPLEQLSPYATTKYEGEQLCREAASFAFPIVVLRFFTVYGPRGRPDMAPYKFLRRVLLGEPIEKFGDGTSARDYTFVDDIVAGVLLASSKLGSLPSPFEIFNLGDAQPVTLNDFIATIEQVAGKKAIIKQGDVQQGDVPSTCANISKARQKLVWEPRIKLRDGLLLTYEDVRSELFPDDEDDDALGDEENAVSPD